MSFKNGLIIGVVVVGALFLLFGSFEIVENVPADQICIIQSPLGTLDVYTTPGPKWQLFGKVTYYPKRSQYSFSKESDVGKTEDQSLSIRFNDGAKASLSGSVAWEMPSDPEHLIELHMKFGSHDAIEQSLVRPVVEKAVYMTGPLMSSKESYAEKRPMIIGYIEDQIQKGVYQTATTQERQTDPLTNQERTVNVVQIRKDDAGNYLRTEESPLVRFGIKAFNPAINEVKYDETVEAQIQQQQKAVMDVQTAVAQAKKAEQDTITATENGKAQAAKAAADQNVELAAQTVKVKTAESYKAEQILRADGDAYARSKAITADGGLEMKINAYKEVMGLWANAMMNHQGQLFPSIVMGGGNGTPTNAQNFMDLMSAKAANDLSLNMKIPGNGNTAPK